MNEPLATFDTVQEIALALPGVEEGREVLETAWRIQAPRKLAALKP